MTMSEWYTELKIRFSEDNYESIYNLLYAYNIKNILEESNYVKAYLPKSKSKIFLQLKNEFKSKKNSRDKDICIKSFRNKEWDKEWKKTINPIFIKDKIIIYPSWLKSQIKKYKDRILIEINPKMSFGTGHNETTQLVLDLMCDFISEDDKSMLDYGSGTGILSIAGIKLGLNKAVALDIDDDSIRDLKEYIKKNNVTEKIKIYKRNISGIREKNFDVICANILRTVIEDNLIYIYKKAALSGKIFLSGILKGEERLMTNSLKKHSFKIFDIRTKAEWIGIYAQKK